MRSKYSITLLSFVFLQMTASLVHSQNQPRGFINNMNGEKCWYTQTTKSEQHFHSIKANTATLSFDDPTCMAGNGLAGDVNRMMIGNIVTRPYGQKDAKFQTRTSELYSTSLLQNRGQCIQSATYPTLGVVIEFFVTKGDIVTVKHAISVQGCKD